MQIYEFINTRLGTDFGSNEDLPFRVYQQEYPHNSIITNYGTVESHAYFLVEGIVQTEVKSPTGEPKILNFFFPNRFFNAYTSFINRAPSKVQVRALSPCKTEVIDYQDIKRLYKKSILINQLGRIITEDIFLEKNEREISLLTKTATERYKALLDENPKLVRYISVKNIAKYLGISPETLSRIRKSIS